MHLSFTRCLRRIESGRRPQVVTALLIVFFMTVSVAAHANAINSANLTDPSVKSSVFSNIPFNELSEFFEVEGFFREDVRGTVVQDNPPSADDSLSVTEKLSGPAVISRSMFIEPGVLFLGELDGWLYTDQDDPAFSDPHFEPHGWTPLRPSNLDVTKHLNDDGYFFGWFRLNFQIDSTMTDLPILLRIGTWGAVEVYIDGRLEGSYGTVSRHREEFRFYNPYNRIPDAITTRIVSGQTYVMAVRVVDFHVPMLYRTFGFQERIDPWVRFTTPEYRDFISELSRVTLMFSTMSATSVAMIMLLLFIIFLMNRGDTLLRKILTLVVLVWLIAVSNGFSGVLGLNIMGDYLLRCVFSMSSMLLFGYTPYLIAYILLGKVPSYVRWFLFLSIPAGLIAILNPSNALPVYLWLIISTATTIWVLISGRTSMRGPNRVVVLALFAEVLLIITYLTFEAFLYGQHTVVLSNFHLLLVFITFPIAMTYYVAARYTITLGSLRDRIEEVKQLSEHNLKIERERKNLIEQQKELLEKEVAERTRDLENSLANLKAAQRQLVEQEKLASLGQLTAGIAHEIKNPLNFVNNFSLVSVELIDEAIGEVNSLPPSDTSAEIVDLLGDIKGNLTKIHEHGSRADRIVKSMLLHSRGGSGKREPADVNALLREYVNLAFHGMRAGKNPIDVEVDLDLDDSVGEIPLVTDDFSRVILNLCNNGFDAMREGAMDKPGRHRLSVSSRGEGDRVVIEVRDNGPGVPAEFRDRILQPFFTTKKGTEGTGLGLSISHDIIKAHGGELTIDDADGGGAVFRISLPATPPNNN